MKAYLAHTGRIAAGTPATRNRIVDFWRVVAILTVVFGHWLAASIWLQPNDEIADCMTLMTERRFRHLPVIEDGKVIGVISIGDLVGAVIAQQQSTIDDLEKYISG